MSTLGARIRKYRKERKLTLEALAGDTLTKGMLSLIENNKANPSMESLTYIAKRLQVDVAELLEEVSTDELREVLAQAEKLYYTDLDRLTDEHEQFISLVEPYIPKLTYGYEAARLLEMYARVLYFEKIEGWKVHLDRSALMYEQMNVTERRASIGIFLSAIQTENYQYKKALETLQKERSEIERQNPYLNPMIQLDFNYLESVLYFAVGDSNRALEIMESSIELSRKKQVFYRIDNLYRLAAFHAIISDDQDRLNVYLTKIEQYAAFADDPNSILFVKHAEIKQLISKDKDYEKALRLSEKYKKEYSFSEINYLYYHLEKGKALFGLRQYEDAIAEFKEIKIPNYLNHPFDLIYLYESDAYMALCYFEIGEQEKAFTHATLAYENTLPMPSLPHKAFINETYEKIVQEATQ